MTVVAGPAGALFVDDGGSGGVPVLFVHSLAGTAGQWAAQLAHLRPARRAAALELRGHGRSAVPPRDYAIPSLALDVAAVADALGLGRFVLVGHSLGGTVTLAYAGAHPARVVGLLLVDPNGDPRGIPPDQLAAFTAALDSPRYPDTVRAHWIRITEGGTPAARAAVLRDLEGTPRVSVVESFKALSVYDPLPALARYRGPKLSLISALNETPAGLHRLVPDLPHRLVPGTGHWIQLDRPDEFNRLLDEFLAGIARS
ncbi:MAG TPA: alpha/beta hydrolase [Gemmatimonadales bacterium]|nr:alpha/beta hydrolase [Gemmatimonadales bacterium]